MVYSFLAKKKWADSGFRKPEILQGLVVSGDSCQYFMRHHRVAGRISALWHGFSGMVDPAACEALYAPCRREERRSELWVGEK